MDYIHLVGAEEVTRAASRMVDAAQSMKSAADSIECALQQHQRFLDDWLSRFQETLSEWRKP